MLRLYSTFFASIFDDEGLLISHGSWDSRMLELHLINVVVVEELHGNHEK